MTELKPCPICGNKKDYLWECRQPLLVPAGKGYRVECPECGLRTKIFQDGSGMSGASKAKKAWNTRYQPTCHNVSTYRPALGCFDVGGHFECSNCGNAYQYASDLPYDYCPFCGARFVGGDA